MVRRLIQNIKTKLSGYLSERSVIRHHQYPTRANTVKSVVYLTLSIPLALLILPLAAVRAIGKGSWRIHVLATEGEFGPFVQLMEVLRSGSEQLSTNDLVVVLSRRRHALCELYESELGLRVLAGNAFRIFIQQAILLQPSPLIRVRRLTDRVHKKLPVSSVRMPDNLVRLRKNLLHQVGAEEGRLVLLAVNVRRYDEENNPQYLAKELALESIGEELAPAIDYLEERSIPLLMVGSRDSGRANIPRDFPRLFQFGRLGGPEEVALASTCRYFWNDNVGAWWLAAPFKRPVLFTNFARFKIRGGNVPVGSMCLPTRYEHPDGTLLSFREILYAKSNPYKSASKGEVRLIRNTPGEIIEAHREMLGRLDGSWSETDESRALQKRYEDVMSDFPMYEAWRIPTGFLSRHPYLLN